MRSIKRLALHFAWAAVTLASSLAAPQSTGAAHHDLVIKNATVMIVTHGNIENGSIYIKNGKIAAVGEHVNAPAGTAEIDAGGKYLTPAIVDSHSHGCRPRRSARCENGREASLRRRCTQKG